MDHEAGFGNDPDCYGPSPLALRPERCCGAWQKLRDERIEAARSQARKQAGVPAEKLEAEELQAEEV